MKVMYAYKTRDDVVNNVVMRTFTQHTQSLAHTYVTQIKDHKTEYSLGIRG